MPSNEPVDVRAAWLVRGLTQAFAGQPGSALLTLERGSQRFPRYSRFVPALVFA